ncbi:lytic transglycosylase domain-containing protein [Sphingomonas sp. ABOLE]|jgi:soluble lytic murein transglycosylase-like protein|uniref:lytic transglycosylase domain-containing protein n=1 Tax=Sphingomonas sp. ABOLE TaxID=1985878 RepID=UPI000F7E2BAB|nr:lytic transglycosylase domain-containing protein [Sphingomonas sp. ABOLE]RSV41793.1 lytic transglycosylase domain-containing protein [Sphingomonas sp. ABOLE]
MRIPCFCIVAVAAVLTGVQAQAQPSRPGRTVEILTMPSLPAARAIDRDEGAGAADFALSDATAVVDAFRTHDLSRRWVSFEMASSFASAGTVDAASDSAAMSAGTAIAGADRPPLALRPPPAIAIPGWMGGRLAFADATTRFTPGCTPTGYRPAGFLSRNVERRRFGYYTMMSSIACEYGIPVGLFDAMIIRESGYQAGVFSKKNAFGLTQLMPGTAAGLGVDRYDVEQNLRGGARYLRRQLDSFGQVHLALAAYNAGPGRVRNGAVPEIVETQDYVENVLLNWRRLADVPRVATVQAAVGAPLPPPLTFGRIASVSSY